MSTDLATLDLCTLADRIRDQEVSAEEVTKFAIARAEALQPALNAFIPVSYTHLTLPTKRIV